MRQSRVGLRDARSRSRGLAIFWLLTARTMSPGWKPTLRGRRVIGDSMTTTPSALGIEPQLIGKRRRDIGDLRAQERRARSDHDLVAAVSGAVSSAMVELHLLAVAQDVESARCRRAAWWRSGSRTHWDPRRLSVDRDDQIASLEARARRRAFRRRRWRPARRPGA